MNIKIHRSLAIIFCNCKEVQIHIKTCLAIFIILSIKLNTYGQKSKSDSTEIAKISIDFYDWYINSIKQNDIKSYSPIFSQNSNGMTILNDSIYISNLKKLSFSNSLIFIEKQSYYNCIKNLNKIKYSDFEKNYNDLDQIENIECDFNNYYRWIGGQEVVDGFSISSIAIDNRTAKLIGYFYINSKENNNKKTTVNNIVIHLIKLNKSWQIQDIIKM